MMYCIHARESATVLATYRTCGKCSRRSHAQAERCLCGGELSRVIEQCVCARCDTRWERWLDGVDNHDGPSRPGQRFGG